MAKKVVTNDGKKGGWLVGKRHYDKNGKSLGGIKAVVTDAGGKPVELEGGEVIINREASKKYWKELSKINQSAGNGVPIEPPTDAFDEDPAEDYENGGKIEFNANHIPNKWILNYAIKIKEEHPDVWALGGNIFGNQAFINLKRVAERGHWLDSEEWMYKKWRAFVARHKGDFRIQGVIAMLKWVDKVDKGWQYMKNLIEEEIKKREASKSKKMNDGGSVDENFKYSKEFAGIMIYTNNEQEYVGENYSPFESKGSFKSSVRKGDLENIAIESDELKSFNFQWGVDDWKSIAKKLKNKGINKLELYSIGKFIKTFQLRPLYKMKNGGSTISQTPAPLKDRVKGSKFNEKGSASTSSKASDIKFDAKTLSSIQNLIDEHNEKYPSKKITLSVAKAVVRRGMGAYSSSHRPTIKGGKPNSRVAWGLARLNAFLYKIVNGKSKSGKYSQDNDLINELGYKVAKYNEGGLIAPNGKPSNLNEEQYKLVRTKAFKDWFGDWENSPETASKVIDENGEPLLVYHSTDEKFNQFDYKTINDSSNYYEIIGFYFTSNKPNKRSRYGNITKACFLNIRNIILVTDIIKEKNPYWETKKLNKNEILLLIGDKNPVYDDFSKEKIIEILVNSDKLNSQLEFFYKQFFSKWQVKDGIRLFLENLTDKLGFNGAYMPHSDYYVAFHPNQIKLADGTNITFDGNNPDIRFSHGGSIELEKGIKAEYEHAKTIAKFKREGVSVRDVARSIAEDHLKEDPHYYSKLEKMEGKKFATGGIVENGISINIGDTGLYGRSKEQITITGITTKIVNFTTSDGKKKGIYIDSFAKNYIPDNASNYVKSGSSQTTTQPSQVSITEWRTKTENELRKDKVLKNDDSYLGISIDTLRLLLGKTLTELDASPIIKDELDRGVRNVTASLKGWAVNSDLFTKDPLPSTQSKVVHELNNYRIKTEQELINEYGKYYRNDTGFASNGDMDWMFGKKITKIVSPTEYDSVLDRIKNKKSFKNEQTLDPGQISWNIYSEMYMFDPALYSENAATNLGQTKPVLSDESLQELFKDVKAIDEEREALEATPQKNETQINDDLKALEDEYNDLLFLIDLTPSTDVDNMLSLKLQAKQLKDRIDLLHLDLKKKIDGELQLLDNLFNASSVQPQERYKFNAYNDGFAPDGQPTSLPKNLYDWTMTQEFQNWFGNFTNAYNYRNSSYENVPCSVVVNKHYEPLVVYHGTGAEFSFFKFDKFPAMYFAENEAYSNWFAQMKGQQSGTNGYVYPFFLNIRTPLDLTIYGIEPVSPGDFIDWMYLQTGLDANELKISKALLDPSQKFQAWMYLRNSPEMLNVLRDKAICDGIVYYEDNPSVDKTSDAYKTKAYIVFNSNSAKIADPNREMMTIPAMRSFYLKRGGKL